MADFSTALSMTIFSGLHAALLFFVPLWGPQLVFRKLTPNKYPDAKLRFSLQDGLLLTVVLALVNTFLAQLSTNSFGLEDHFATIMLAASVNVLVLLLWIKCLQFLAQHKIARTRSRLLMQFVLYPLSTLVIAEILMGALMLFTSLEALFHEGGFHPIRYLEHPLTRAGICVIIAFWLMRYLLRYLFVKFVVSGIDADESPVH